MKYLGPQVRKEQGIPFGLSVAPALFTPFTPYALLDT